MFKTVVCGKKMRLVPRTGNNNYLEEANGRNSFLFCGES